jgi:hypothetical protein
MSRPQVADHHLLFPVLVASHEEEIDGHSGKILAQPDFEDAKLDPTPGAPLSQSGDVSTVSVKIQKTGIEVHEVELRVHLLLPVLADVAQPGHCRADVEHRGIGWDDKEG